MASTAATESSLSIIVDTADSTIISEIEALSILEPMGTKVEIKGKSKVKKQSPNAVVSYNIYQKITLKP